MTAPLVVCNKVPLFPKKPEAVKKTTPEPLAAE